MNSPTFRIFHGIDIVEVKRIARLAQTYRERFLNRVFTPQELTYAFKRKNPFVHLAGRFAAKEAGVKALAPLIKTTISQFETFMDKNGSPYIVFNGNSNIKGELSISHTNELAFASVVFILNL